MMKDKNKKEEEDNEEDVPPRPKQKLSRVRARIAKDHLVEQIYNDIQTGRITRSKTRLANFCEHYSFISSIEPMKVEEVLEDLDWINAMHEELHNFERNQVWTLVEKPDNNHNIIGTKWVFRNKQDEDGQVIHNKARLVAQGYTQVEVWKANVGEVWDVYDEWTQIVYLVCKSSKLRKVPLFLK